MTVITAPGWSQERLAALKMTCPVEQIAGQWVTLRRRGKRMVGPCPICSTNPQSRTAARFEIAGDRWMCAVCQDGGDVIALVMRRRGCTFDQAVRWLGGDRLGVISARERRQIEQRTRQTAERARTAEQFRQRELQTLRDIWDRALPLDGTPAHDYLRRRGIVMAADTLRLRCVLAMPYYYAREIIGRAPAMVGMIERDGALSGLHLTWIDLAAATGKGKAVFVAPDTGEILPAKKCRGSVAGGHIVLVTPGAPRRLILAEGIETALSVWQVFARNGRDDGLAVWSGIDLGNLGGAAIATLKHPTLKTRNNRPLRVPGPVPDFSRPGIVLAPSIAEVTLLRDGDSEAVLTDYALQRGKERFFRQRPDVVVRIARCPDGMDFNDWCQAEAG